MMNFLRASVNFVPSPNDVDLHIFTLSVLVTKQKLLIFFLHHLQSFRSSCWPSSCVRHYMFSSHNLPLSTLLNFSPTILFDHSLRPLSSTILFDHSLLPLSLTILLDHPLRPFTSTSSPIRIAHCQPIKNNRLPRESERSSELSKSERGCGEGDRC